MKSYLGRRVLVVPVTLFVVSLIVFVVAQLLPGDVGRSVLGPYATAGQVRQLDHRLGYDRPLPSRYGHWIGGFVTGRWGDSPVLQVPLRPLVMSRIGDSLLLALVAFVIVVPLSVGLGVLAGLRHGSRTDRALSIAGLALLGIPEFVGGTIVLVVIGVGLRWLPTTAAAPDGSGLATRIHYLLLPAIPLVFVLFGYLSRMARAGVADTVNAPFVQAAALRGLPRRSVVGRHLLPNALLPTLTVVTFQIGYLVGGLVVIERLFNYQGVGNLLLTSATSHDIPALADITMLLASLTLLLSLCADLTYAALNPRIRFGAS